MIIILTIYRRMHLALATKKSLMEHGVKSEEIMIIEGFDKLDFPDMNMPHRLLTRAFFERWLPLALQLHGHCYYVEDGTLFNENPLLINKQYNKINWLGYIFNQKHYTCGTKCIYFPREIIKLMSFEPPDKKRWGHLDRVIRKYGEEKDILYVLPSPIISQMNYKSDWGTKHQLLEKERKKKKMMML